VGILDLLVMLAQDDGRVVRVPVPKWLHAPPPAVRARLLEDRSRRKLSRALHLHRPSRVLEALAGGMVLKRYLVGLGNRLQLEGGGIYAIEGRFAYIVDSAGGGVTLRDEDEREVASFAPAGSRLVVIS
jgi:hypothetical protein